MFNDCLPKFITLKLRFQPVCSQWNQWAKEREIVFHTIRRRVLYRGSRVLQVLLKALLLRGNVY